MKITRRILALILSFVLFFSVAIISSAEEIENTKEQSIFHIDDYISYQKYLERYSDKTDADATVVIDCNTQLAGVEQTSVDNVSGAYLPQDEIVEYKFFVEQSGFYNLELLYYAVDAADTSLKLDLKVDNENPFDETANLTLFRKWGFENEVSRDAQGNDIRQDSVESPQWIRTILENTSGVGGEALKFYLTAGEHTVQIEMLQNPMILSEICFVSPHQSKPYNEVLKQWKEKGYKEVQKSLEPIQAELAVSRSEKSIAMINDRSSAATTPYHAYHVRYNCIGGSTWKTAGEWIEWEVDVPESGLYTLGVRFLQNEKNDDVSTRTLTIDGQLPFKEAANITFPYSSSWQTALFNDGNIPYQFYLEEGIHTIRMTAALGDTAEIINEATVILDKLNEIYINIVMVTGTEPDTNRDYGIAKLLPDVLEEMKNVQKELKNLEKEQNKIVGDDKGNPTFRRLYEQLELMLEKPEKIPKRLSNFQSNVTALGTWINDSRSQPLMLDYIQLLSPKADVPKAEKGFWDSLVHHVVQFFGSFITDYSAVGSTEQQSDRKITIWIGTGRDQADIIRKMINSQFTPEYGIEVELQLVNAGALLPATLAGIGPDVCLSITETEPVNYALRDAVVDLSKLEGSKEVLSRFHEASLTAFELDGGVYALPETMEYPMLFYRKDILAELNINEEDLKTWDTLLQNVLPELTLSYFDFGLTTDMKSYASLLYQQGGEFYNNDKTASMLNQPEAYEAFRTMTRLYTDYKIPKTFDFVNRFRSGQMPLAITSYTAYNQLSVFAPEIEGKWGMTTLPGVIDKEGNINNTATTTVSGAIIMKDSENIDDAWTFLKWWTQGDVQSEYANELETILGTAARYPIANLEAMETIQWNYDIKKALKEQQENLEGVPQIAGSYYTNRYFDFAFRDVVENAKNDRESLLEASENITNEIIDKRHEIYGEE